MADRADTLIALYREAYQTILELIATREMNGKPVDIQRAMLADIAEILTSLDASTRVWIEAQLPQVYRQAQMEILDELRSPLAATFGGVHTAAVEILASNLYANLQDAQRVVGRRVEDLFREVGLEAVARKTTTGQLMREAQRALRTALAEQGVTAFVDAQGRQWRLDTYADMAVRSTVAETQNHARINQLSELGYDLVKMTEHFPTCDLCAARQGRVYSISGKDTRFPALWETAFGEYANVHPNCAHRLAPVVEALTDNMDELIERSNRPFDVDPRTEKQREAYEAGQAKRRRARERRRKREEKRMQAVL